MKLSPLPSPFSALGRIQRLGLATVGLALILLSLLFSGCAETGYSPLAAGDLKRAPISSADNQKIAASVRDMDQASQAVTFPATTR